MPLLQDTERLVEPNLCQLHVDFCVNLLALSLLPGSLCSHHIGNLHYAFLESEVGASEVFLSAGNVSHRHIELLLSFLHLELALRNLKVNLLAHIIQVHLGDIGGCLRCSHLIGAVKPVPYWHLDDDSYVPYSCEFLLESIENIRI